MRQTVDFGHSFRSVKLRLDDKQHADPVNSKPISLGERPRRRRRPVLWLVVALGLLGASGLFAAVEAIDAHQLGDQARLHGSARALAAVVDTQIEAFVGASLMLGRSPHLGDLGRFEAEARAAGAALGGWFVLIGPGPAHPILIDTRLPPEGRLPETASEGFGAAFHASLPRVLDEKQPLISDRFQAAVAAVPALAAVVPVDHPDRPRHLLAFAFEPAVLQAQLAVQPLSVGRFAAVVDGNRAILAASLGAESPPQMQDSAVVLDALTGADAGRNVAEHVLVVERPARAPGWSVILGAPRAQQRSAVWNMLPWLMTAAMLFGCGVMAVIGMLRRDALDAARAEAEALREGRAEIERLHGGLPAIIFLSAVSAEGRARRLYRSGDVGAVTGLDPSDFDAALARRQADPAVQSRLRVFYQEVLKAGLATSEFPLVRPDTSSATLEITARVLERGDGEALVVGYILDITGRREAERRAATAARLASLGETAACLAHEVKQPLLAMSLAAELGAMALQRNDISEAERLLGSIVDRAQRTADMIERLRRFARGAEELAQNEDVPLDLVVAGARDLVGPTLAAAGVEIRQDLGMPTPVVQGQAILLEQVLANLLLNARDAMAARPATQPRVIRIHAERRPQGLVSLEVADTGGGIAPAIMAQLFEPFVTSKGSDQGTGLGLSVARSLVRAMGGSIEARNVEEGASFTILLREAEAPGKMVCGLAA